MSVTTYVGFSIVSVMCIAWLVLPFTSLKLRWPLGTGLRNTIGLDSSNFKHILDDLLSFSIGDFTVPTGLILFMLLCCFLVWLFSRSRTGVAMQAVGNNPRFAEATGISVDRMRIVGTVLSTVLGAVGILVYSQSYGFMQLYTAPRQMGFIAASAIQPVQDQPRDHRYLPVPGRAYVGHAGGQYAGTRHHPFRNAAHPDFQRYHSVCADQVWRWLACVSKETSAHGCATMP